MNDRLPRSRRPRCVTATLLFAACLCAAVLSGVPARAEEPAVPLAVNQLQVLPLPNDGVLNLADTLTIRATGTYATEILAEVSSLAHRRLTLYLNGIEMPGLMSSYNGKSLAQLQADVAVKERKLEELRRKDRDLDAGIQNLTQEVSRLSTSFTGAEAHAKLNPNSPDAAVAVATARVAKAEAETNLRLAKDEKNWNLVLIEQAVEEEKAARGWLAFAPVVNLSFIVTRDSENEASRKAWDALFRPMKGYTQELTVDLSVGGRHPVPVEGPGGKPTVTFRVSEFLGLGFAVGLGVLAACGAILGLKPKMLRENGDPALAFSLGRVQMAFWGVVVISCFAGVAASCGTLEYIPAQVLVLLGISSVTALSASIIGSGSAPSPKSDRPGVLGFFDDICVGDSGASFHRVQVVLWTLVLGIYFVSNVLQMMSMPVFPDTLLVLMGISSGTYLGFKMQEGKLDVTLPEIKNGELRAMISGGSGPYQWSCTCDPATALTLTPLSGTLEKVGALTVKVSAPTADGKLKLVVTDKAGASVTIPFEFKKLTAAAPTVREGKLITTVAGSTGPFTWDLASVPATAMTPISGELKAPGELAIPLALKTSPATLTLTVKDQTGASVPLTQAVTL
ncbi:MAG TPA: hypothetical protein VD994_11325, partial [Prosthecobacter sp.]|nr:hypothetical protein [Prosthecobacter sp.]